ncbi:uncharacterized protein LOC130648665 [Hydractinia symbiolongicarpus]|uniref:uncharacterized protein LOC130648665 n=1 Tax=Hydractinia symbiolongicarpus TaxID=13093 RepID=UPI00254E8CF5|nr:uncharacterized protein LOC130648665 [Hydractinia symbiolongicarpus]
MVSQDRFLLWKKKRNSTYIVFLVLYFLMGLELGCVNATLWIYVSTVVKPNNPELFYGLIVGCFFAPPILFSPVLSRFADKTRRVKLCLISVIYLSIAGSILYTIHTSPLFPLFGRFLSGFTMAVTPLMVSEVARSYPKEKVSQKLMMINGSRLIGYACGPCISIFCFKTDFWIGSIHITYANVIGPVLFVICCIILVVVLIFTHDLSREYDMKAESMERKNIPSASAFSTTKKIFQTKDTLLMIIICIFFGVMDQINFRILPMIVITRLNFSYSVLNILLMGVAFANIALVAFLLSWRISNKEVYYTGIISLLSVILTSLLLLLLYYRVGHVTGWYVMLIANLLCNVVFFLSDQTFAVIVCAKLAHSCNQGFLEGVRLFSIQSGRVVGAICIGMYYSHMKFFYPSTTALSIMLLTLLILRRKTLSNPVPVI